MGAGASTGEQQERGESKQVKVLANNVFDRIRDDCEHPIRVSRPARAAPPVTQYDGGLTIEVLPDDDTLCKIRISTLGLDAKVCCYLLFC